MYSAGTAQLTKHGCTRARGCAPGPPLARPADRPIAFGAEPAMPDEPRLNAAARAAVRLRQLRERPAAVERRQQLTILVFGPRLAGVARRRPLPSRAPPSGGFERPDCAVQRADDVRRLVRTVDCKQLAGERVDPVGERRHDRECPGFFHDSSPRQSAHCSRAMRGTSLRRCATVAAARNRAFIEKFDSQPARSRAHFRSVRRPARRRAVAWQRPSPIRPGCWSAPFRSSPCTA